jgi:hypothetical protein
MSIFEGHVAMEERRSRGSKETLWKDSKGVFQDVVKPERELFTDRGPTAQGH